MQPHGLALFYLMTACSTPSVSLSQPTILPHFPSPFYLPSFLPNTNIPQLSLFPQASSTSCPILMLSCVVCSLTGSWRLLPRSLRTLKLSEKLLNSLLHIGLPATTSALMYSVVLPVAINALFWVPICVSHILLHNLQNLVA